MTTPSNRAESCSTCHGACTSPAECHLPVRPKTFEPDFGVKGPFLPTTRAGWARWLERLVLFALACFALGAVLTHCGVIR